MGQVRENTLLSHDLFEGIYGRAALVTDIILYEEYPARYLIYTRRLRRWISRRLAVAALVVPHRPHRNRVCTQPPVHHQPLENF